MAAQGTGSAAGKGAEGGGEPPERIPVMQQVLDNPFLLLFLGVASPAILYLIWGIMEITQIPIGK